MLNMQTIGQGMVRFSERFGDPTVTLRIVIPSEYRRQGHAFNIKQTEPGTTFEYRGARGGWSTDREQQLDQMGQVNVRDGAVAIHHKKFNVAHDELRRQIKADGAQVFIDDISVIPTAVLDDAWADATYISFDRIEVGRGPG